MRYFEERYPKQLEELEEDLLPISREILNNLDNNDNLIELMKSFRQRVIKFSEVTRSHIIFFKDKLSEKHLHLVTPAYILESFNDPDIKIIFKNVFDLK